MNNLRDFFHAIVYIVTRVLDIVRLITADISGLAKLKITDIINLPRCL